MVELYGLSRAVGNAKQEKNYKMNFSCPQWDSNPQPSDQKSQAAIIIPAISCRNTFELKS